VEDILCMFSYSVSGFLRRSASFIRDCDPGVTGWRLGRGHGGGLGRETTSWRLGEGLQDGIRCVPGGAHLKKHTLLKVNTVTKKALRRYLMFFHCKTRFYEAILNTCPHRSVSR
jgi:hypothetical protein